MRRLLASATALLAVVAGQPAAAERPAVSSLSVEGTEFVVGLADGRTLRSRDLAGAILDVHVDGRPVKVRLAGVERDPGDKSGTVWLHTFEGRTEDGSWQNLCMPGPDGRRQGFPLQGGASGVEFTCTAGAVGKCVRFGYRPWASGPQGESLAPQHVACVHMLRGDYGGNGEAWTADNTLIDVYDPLGLQEPDPDGNLAFEAGWAPDGAVCVHHARVKEKASLPVLEGKYPRLAGRTGAVCTEAFAKANGAIVFNRSRP